MAKRFLRGVKKVFAGLLVLQAAFFYPSSSVFAETSGAAKPCAAITEALRDSSSSDVSAILALATAPLKDAQSSTLAPTPQPQTKTVTSPQYKNVFVPAVKISSVKVSTVPVSLLESKTSVNTMQAPFMVLNPVWGAVHGMSPVARMFTSVRLVPNPRFIQIALTTLSDKISYLATLNFKYVPRALPKGVRKAPPPPNPDAMATALNDEFSKTIDSLSADLPGTTNIQKLQRKIGKDVVELEKDIKDAIERCFLSTAAGYASGLKKRFRGIIGNGVAGMFEDFVSDLEKNKSPTPEDRIMLDFAQRLIAELRRDPAPEFSDALIAAVEKMGLKDDYRAYLVQLLEQKGVADLFAMLDKMPPIFDQLLDQLVELHANLLQLEYDIRHKLDNIEQLSIPDDKMGKMRLLIATYLDCKTELDPTMKKVKELFKSNILAKLIGEFRQTIVNDLKKAKKPLSGPWVDPAAVPLVFDRIMKDSANMSEVDLNSAATELAREIAKALAPDASAGEDAIKDAVTKGLFAKFGVILIAHVQRQWCTGPTLAKILNDEVASQGDLVPLEISILFGGATVAGIRDVIPKEVVQQKMRDSAEFQRISGAFGTIDAVLGMIRSELGTKKAGVMTKIKSLQSELLRLQGDVAKQGQRVLDEIAKQTKAREDAERARNK